MAEEHQYDPLSSSSNPQHEVFNAAGRVAENIINYFIAADYYMGYNDLINWWIHLDKAYMQAEFTFKKEDREAMEKLWKKINPYQKSSYGLLKEYHLKLRRLCTKFFTMGETNKGPAIWRR